MSITQVALPKYTTTLPMSGLKVTYRPFTVKEEKILLIAQESNDTEQIIGSISQIMESCTFGKYTVDSLNKIDAEFLFVQVRNKSMGEGIEVNGICTECDAKTHMTLNMENVVVEGKTDKALANVEISEGFWITLKYPTFKESMSLVDDDGMTALALSLDTIVNGEDSFTAGEYTIKERVEFIESLSSAQVLKLKPFFDKFPRLVFEQAYKCSKCGHDNLIRIEGMENFFG